MVKNLPANTGDTGDVGSIPGSGRSCGGGNGNPLQYSCLENLKALKATLGFPSGSVGKTSPASVPDAGSIPGSGRSPGEGNGNPPQHSCLENRMDRGAWWATVHGVTKESVAT